MYRTAFRVLSTPQSEFAKGDVHHARYRRVRRARSSAGSPGAGGVNHRHHGSHSSGHDRALPEGREAQRARPPACKPDYALPGVGRNGRFFSQRTLHRTARLADPRSRRPNGHHCGTPPSTPPPTQTHSISFPPLGWFLLYALKWCKI